jgi:hypothetical protein
LTGTRVRKSGQNGHSSYPEWRLKRRGCARCYAERAQQAEQLDDARLDPIKLFLDTHPLSQVSIAGFFYHFAIYQLR